VKKIGKKLSEILFVALCCVLLFPMTAMAVESAIMPEKNELFARFYIDGMNPAPSKPEPIYITIETDDNGHFSFDYPALTILDETRHYYFSGMHIEGVAYISDGSGTVKFDHVAKPVLVEKGYQYGALNVRGLQSTLKIDWLVDNEGTFKEWQTLTFTFEKGTYNMYRSGSKVMMQFTVHYRVESSLGEDGYDFGDHVESFKMLPIDFTIAGASDEKNSIIDTHADKDKGETDVSIPEALAIVIIGGAAAMAGAGGSGKNGNDDDGKRRSRYKMCLRKDFGDAIRYDTQPVTVYARIVEITPEGEEIDRPDLSARIEMFSGGGLKVESTAIADNYMGALVCAESVPGGQNPDSGVLSIRFSGEGGSFQNNVTFRLVGKPCISFPEQGHYLTMTLPMLLGDGEVYETPVILSDFLEKPTSVRLDVAEGVPLSCKLEETEEADETRYLLKVKNLSGKPETPQAVKLMFGIGILAENDKEKAEEGVKAELYPEGLSIREVKFDDQGYVLIDALDQEATDEWGDVVPTDFVLDFVVPEQRDDGRRIVRVLDPKDFSPAFGGLKGTDERTAHLAERFRYTIRETQGNSKAYEFAPQEALVEEKGKPYYLTLPISCAYGQEEYTLDLPIRLLGGGPGPLAGWDEAFANMKKIVSKVGGISPEIARLLRENGKKMSTAELRLVTRKICHDAIVYYTKDAAEYEKIAAELDNMLYYAEWLKWFGDQAFSYLISTYYGDTADAILSPAKDIFASFLGEVIGQLASGETFDWEALEVGKNINAAFDNLISNAFDNKMGKKISFKQVCAVVGGFVVWKIAKNVYDNMDNDGKVDLYSAITATVSDFTVMGMKKIAGNFFDKALNNKVVQENLNTPLGKWLQDLAPDTSLVKWVKDNKGNDAFEMIDFNKSDIFKKYMEEIFGMGMAKVTEIDMEAVKGLQELRGSSMDWTLDLSAWPQIDWTKVLTDASGHAEAFRISINMGPEALGKLYGYLFGALFGDVPFDTEAKSPPVDPPYLSE
jgi:hypothetical protein